MSAYSVFFFLTYLNNTYQYELNIIFKICTYVSLCQLITNNNSFIYLFLRRMHLNHNFSISRFWSCKSENYL